MATRTGVLPPDEDGYELWLRYRTLPAAPRRRLLASARALLAPRPATPMTDAVVGELGRAIGVLCGRAPGRAARAAPGTIVLATPQSQPALAAACGPLEDLGDEGYVVRTAPVGRGRAIIVCARHERGLLYGGFALIRALQLGADPRSLDLRSAPALSLRLLNHWDNLDRSVERGYAGQSIWDWWKLPSIVDARYADHARACASVGINGVVLNNVNAASEVLSAAWIAKAAALADVFRPWGVRVYLSVRFSAPRELGGQATADPADAGVQRWWADKAAEIHRAIPDFGGWLVKANSEGQPGPQDYGRSHAEGANTLARALAPHGSVLMWRAFVYAAENPRDRAMQAYDEFVPLDGQFLPNVIVQVKNGPIDFQPREPFHPLFGAMRATPLILECQLTKEYLGFSTHLAYLGPMWEEVLRSDTHRPQAGHTVAATLTAQPRAGMAGVANIGSDRNWCGSHFDQANWYAYGRLAWDVGARSRAIAAEWAVLTFGNDPAVRDAVVRMMMASREAVVDYMTPLGLHHLMDTGHHHGPGPWVSELNRPEWNPTYYHRADRHGIGFDRSTRGSGAVSQYAEPLARRWDDPQTTPEELLLWFHHLPWGHPMPSGRDLWHELAERYDRGVRTVQRLRATWRRLQGHVDARRHRDVSEHLAQQHAEARWWRDACLAYFQSVNGRPWPEGVTPPAGTLAEYRAMRFAFAPGRGG
ncbi:MAG: alpha-glucuronidase [Rubrivivax sp.]|nr:alpha-glucuronidase [Rubrivivax sp.]